MLLSICSGGNGITKELGVAIDDDKTLLSDRLVRFPGAGCELAKTGGDGESAIGCGAGVEGDRSLGVAFAIGETTGAATSFVEFTVGTSTDFESVSVLSAGVVSIVVESACDVPSWLVLEAAEGSAGGVVWSSSTMARWSNASRARTELERGETDVSDADGACTAVLGVAVIGVGMLVEEEVSAGEFNAGGACFGAVSDPFSRVLSDDGVVVERCTLTESAVESGDRNSRAKSGFGETARTRMAMAAAI